MSVFGAGAFVVRLVTVGDGEREPDRRNSLFDDAALRQNITAWFADDVSIGGEAVHHAGDVEGQCVAETEPQRVGLAGGALVVRWRGVRAGEREYEDDGFHLIRLVGRCRQFHVNAYQPASGCPRQ